MVFCLKPVVKVSVSVAVMKLAVVNSVSIVVMMFVFGVVSV